jgi:protein phosphatase
MHKEMNTMNRVIFETTSKLQISGAGQSIQGRRRVQNDDIVFSRTEATKDVGVYVMCDGLGGHQNGKIASQLAVGTIISVITRTLLPTTPSTKRVSGASLRRLIRQSVQLSNVEIMNYAAKHLPPGSKMGTTVTLALIYQGKLHVAHVGNGRAYLYRDEQIRQLTEDHSIAAELVKNGFLNEEDLIGHHHRKTLLRMLGHEQEVDTDIIEQKLKTGDKLLLCSDGLWQAYPQPAELAAVLSTDAPPSRLCEELITTANKRDGSDNISAVVVMVDGVNGWQLNFPEAMIDIWQNMKAHVS